MSGMSHGGVYPEFTVLGPRGELLRCVGVPRGLTARETVEVILAQHHPELVNGAFPVYLTARADQFGGWSHAGQDEPFDAVEPLTTELWLRQDRDPTHARYLDWIKIATFLAAGTHNDGAGNAARDLLEQTLATAKADIEQRERDRLSQLSEETAVAIATSCACLRLGIDDLARLQAHHIHVTRHWERIRLESWRVPLTDRQQESGNMIVQLEVIPKRLEASELLIRANHRPRA
ncbi:hypothetical protein ACFO0M_17635 [Micromonospora mangrovi]|uniref:Uncharacterized protein n=2 Tax=Micromonospora TaxID=1873 RepID=A0AAU7MDN2_9ACTN